MGVVGKVKWMYEIGDGKSKKFWFRVVYLRLYFFLGLGHDFFVFVYFSIYKRGEHFEKSDLSDM
jgi:hypothetical protein